MKASKTGRERKNKKMEKKSRKGEEGRRWGYRPMFNDEETSTVFGVRPATGMP